MKFQSYINAQWIGGARGSAILNPSDTAETVGYAHWATAADAEAALQSAKQAFPIWRDTLPTVRAQYLRSVGDELLKRADELGRLLSSEEGKTLKEGIGEIRRSGDIFHYYAGECVRGAGEFMPGLRAGFTTAVSREPIGVVSLITAWNFPMMLPAMKVAAALAYGNTVVLKPSELTPGCAWALADIIDRARLPAGVFNLVLGPGAEFGSILTSRPDGVSFTGSTGVGRAIIGEAARHLVKVQAEMGGKNALIIADDANVDLAIEIAVQGMYYSTGQRCTATSRLIVLPGIYDRFIERLVRRITKIKVGHALADDTEVGPVANAGQLRKNIEYIALAQQEGASLLAGGKQVECPTQGHYLAPTLFADTHSRMRINQEEVFGPVGAVIRAGDLDEAIAIANDVEFGLSSGICTQNLIYAEQFRRNSKAGMVMINAPTSGADFHVPLGGRGQSGYGGKELGSAAIEFFTETKTTYTNTSNRL